MTEKLYYNDSKTIEFESEIIEINSSENKFEIILDKTYFYPTSGGQNFDTGFINGIKVLDVFENNGKIVHVLEAEVNKGKVIAKIDYKRRLENMQHHTGQHLLSQAFIKVLKAPTISIHLGDDICNIEIVKKDLTQEEVNQVEDLANDIIYQNKKINIHYVDEEQINNLDLRRPPKKKGSEGIRVIEIEDFDMSACGGTHAHSTGDLGMIKIIGFEKYKGNIKVEFICGLRALHDYRFKNNAIKNISAKFSAKVNQIEEIINKSIVDNKENLKEISSLKKGIATYQLKELLSKAELYKGYKIINEFFLNTDINSLKLIAQEIIEIDNAIAILYSQDKGKNSFVFCCDSKLKINMNKYLSELLKELEGKGGGKPNLTQGSSNKNENIQEIIIKYVEIMKTDL